MFTVDNVIFCFAQCTPHHLPQVLETFGGSGPARALYYYRTGDILDDHTLKRLQNLAKKAIVGENNCDSPCDRMIRDLRAKSAAGELEFMIVSAPADTADEKLAHTLSALPL